MDPEDSEEDATSPQPSFEMEHIALEPIESDEDAQPVHSPVVVVEHLEDAEGLWSLLLMLIS